MALQLSGSINVIGGFITTEGGTYSGSGFYEDIFLSGSVYDSVNSPGSAEQVLTLNDKGKAKWRNMNSVKADDDQDKKILSDFNYSITWEGGLDFSGSATSIPIIRDNYYIEETVINLNAADATFARFDIIVATTGSNNTGSFEVVEGTPAQSPFYPAYDENKSIALKYILVRAAATDAAVGGDGNPDNGDGTNDPDDDDQDDNYYDFNTLTLFDENTADEWKPNTTFFKDGYWTNYDGDFTVENSSTYAQNGTTGISIPLYKSVPAAIDTRRNPVQTLINYSTSVRAFGIDARNGNLWQNGSYFDFKQMDSISFYLKNPVSYPVGYVAKMYLLLHVRNGKKASGWQNFSVPLVLHNPEDNYDEEILQYSASFRLIKFDWQTVGWKKITLPNYVFTREAKYSSSSSVVVGIGAKVYHDYNRHLPGVRSAAESVTGNSIYNLYLDNFKVTKGGGTADTLPTELASKATITENSQLPLFDIKYGSPTIKNLKINSKGTKLIGGYSNILGGSNNILSGSLIVTSSIFSEVTRSFEIVDGPEYSSIVGGYENFISGSITGSVIVGGFNNKVTSNFSTVLGGQNNTSSFDNTFIIGCNLTADKTSYTFVNNIDIQGTASASIFSGSFVGDGSGLTGITATASPAGTNTQVQFNNSGVLGASSNFTYDGTTLNLAYTGTNDLLRLTSTDGGALSAPDLTFCRNSASPADQDTLGVIQFFGQSDFPASKNYASIFSRIGCATAGQTRGNLLFKADRCNVFVNTLTISPEGLYILPPSDTAETEAGIGLTVNGTISGSSNLIIEGTVSASIFSGSFVGDGSGLTGISGGGGGGDYSPFITGSINSTGILPREGDNSPIVGANATVAGGTLNTGSGQCTFIGGGELNYASTSHGSIVGGCKNKALSPQSAVVGGHDNQARANQSFIGAGRYNTVCGYTGGIVSGDSNCISSAINYSFIGGGTLNTASAHCSAILGGDRNYISGSHNNSFIIGSDITSSAECTTFVNNFKAQGPSSGTTVVILENLPTINPNNPGQLWSDSGTLKIST